MSHNSHLFGSRLVQGFRLALGDAHKLDIEITEYPAYFVRDVGQRLWQVPPLIALVRKVLLERILQGHLPARHSLHQREVVLGPLLMEERFLAQFRGIV